MKFKLTLLLTFFLSATWLVAQDCNQKNLLFSQNFSKYDGKNQKYTLDMLRTDFSNAGARTSSEIRGIGPQWVQETRVIDGALRAQFPKNKASGRDGGILFDNSFEDVEEATLEYRLKFNENFYWAAGGKLPGLGGSAFDNKGAIPSGCVDRGSRNSDNGFSCRLMWRTNRAHTAKPKLVVYTYHPKRPKDCGEDFDFIRDIKKGKWYTIQQYIKLNTPGQKNGVLRMFVDGQKLLDKNDVEFRLPGKNNVKINSFIMNTYRGGARTDNVWFSPTTDYIYFDDIKVWKNCSEIETEVNKLPQVTFKNTEETIVVNPGYRLNLEVAAIDEDGTIADVKLFINETLVRSESKPPYEWGHEGSPDTDELNNLPVGQHQIKVIATDNRGGTSEATLTLKVENNTLTVNENIHVQKQVQVTPNPFYAELKVIFGNFNLARIQMYNASGQLVKNVTVNEQLDFTIDTSNLSEGMYFMELFNVEGQKIVRKIIKR